MLSKVSLVLGLLLLVSVAQAAIPGDFNLSATEGPTHIKWNWSVSDSFNWSKTIFLDGSKLVDNETTLGYYVQHGIDNNEEHRMDLYIFNVSNTSEGYSKSYTTRTEDTTWYWWTALAVLFMVLGYFVWLFNIMAVLTSMLTFNNVWNVTTNEYTLTACAFMVLFTILISWATFNRR